MAVATNLGFPRIGPNRELKKALEGFWAGRLTPEELLERSRGFRRDAWQLQERLGLDVVPCGDFSLYDHVLDTAALVGAVPRRYGWSGGAVELRTYFAMARGLQERADQGAGSLDVPAMEMTKWFDTNYHYLVPEFEHDLRFRLGSEKPLEEFAETRELGIHARPVLLGPVTFLLLGKARAAGRSPLQFLSDLLPVYEEILRKLAAAGADWVQIDEPVLVLDLEPDVRKAFRTAYERLAGAAPGLRTLIATYFGPLGENRDVALELPVNALHLDLARAPEQLDSTLRAAPEHLALSLGIIDVRNIWRADLTRALETVDRAVEAIGPDRVLLAPSCSLLHVPIDLDAETGIDPEIRPWLAFAREKIVEVSLLTRAVNDGKSSIEKELRENRAVLEQRRTSARTRDPDVRNRLARVIPEMIERRSPFPDRRTAQKRGIDLPALPTTTIGSFPQTREVRSARASHKSGRLSDAQYDEFLRGAVGEAIRAQEEIGLDVLVHGEPERNDMVEYFGERLSGFVVTKKGWVQSYGSRCVKPPIISGDVSRPEPMTVEWSRYAQSLTRRPVKGMLTGPVTILQWSFARDDLPRSESCRQIALAIRDEVADLEMAGIRVIQIDEPALREGLPLREADRPAYLDWAVNAFRLASCGVSDETQIHTHMCYSEFNDIIESIGALDADVISIEASRSQMELLDAFVRYRYPNEIGPGVYDIHSPRVPSIEEMQALIEKALQVLSRDQVWVNPDCGLKTRGWEEVRQSLSNLVEVARRLR
jgi:5-methyltetrahydropteroyltriglutamate--homocysteine methyltransferase